MHDMLSDDTNIPEWVQSKITLAEDYISTASNYMQGEMSEELKGNQHKIDANKNGKVDAHDFHLLRKKKRVAEEVEGLDYDLFESIMLGEGDLSIRTLYNKYADHALGAGDKPEPKKAAAVKKAITKVHGSTVMGHLEKAKNAAAKNDQESESHHFNAARSSAKTDTMGATVGKGRSSMRKEEVDLDEGRMKDIAVDINSLSHEDFKRKHRKTKQEMQDSLKNEEVDLLDEANENFDSNSKAHQAAKKAVKGWRGLSKATYHSDGSATINTKERTKNRYGKEGHYSGLETTHSHSVVDQHLKYAGGMHNHSKDELDNHKQKIDGLHWKVKGKTVRGVGGTHEIHIHEEVEGIHELKRETVRTYYNKAIAQGKPIADKMKMGGGDWSKDGQDTKTLNKRAAGVKMALRRRSGQVKMSEDAIDEKMSTSGETPSVYGGRASSAKEKMIADFNKPKNKNEKPNRYTKEEVEQVDEVSKRTLGRYINKAKDSIDMTSYRSGIKDGTAISSSTPYTSNNPLEKKLTRRHKGIETAVKKLTKEDIDAVKKMNESYKTAFDAALVEYNIKSPSELGESKRKEFFNYVDLEFKKGDN